MKHLFLLTISLTCLISSAAAQNQPPVLEPISDKTVPENSILNFTVTATDPDGTTPDLYTSEPLPRGAVFDPQGDGTGDFLWKPDYTQEGAYEVRFYADDGEFIDSEVVTITVTHVDAPPVLDSIRAKTGYELFELIFDISATDADGTIPNFSALNLPSGASFEDNLDGTGTFSWTPNLGELGDYNVTFIATDGALTDMEVVTITIVDNLNPPILDPVPDKSVLEGQILAFFVYANDADGSIPILSAGNLPAGATFTDNRNRSGSFNWRPGGDQAGLYTVKIYATDFENTDSIEVNITVTDDVYPPELDSIGSKTVHEGILLTFMVSASDQDGTFPELSINVPPGGNPSLEDNLDGTGIFSFMPDASHGGDNLFTFYASDGVFIDSEVVTITVIPNLPPELLPIGSKSVTEGGSLIFDVVATDPDEGTSFILTAEPIPANAIWTVHDDDSTGTFEFYPDYTQAGIYEITFAVTDGGLADTELVTIEVFESGNQLPVLTEIGPQEVLEGQQLSFEVTATDLDDTALILETSALPENATFVDNGDGTGSFSFTPGCTQQGLYPVVFKVTDEQGGVDSEVVEITVIDGGNWEPVLEPIGPHALQEGYSLEFYVIAEDCEGEIESIWIDPSVDDTIYKGDVSFEDLGDGTALFGFFPGYDLVAATQEIIRVKFYASDGIDIDSEEVVITVYDVQPDSKDPGEADTLIFEGHEWDGVDDLSITCYIWNDSAISGAITGFRWFDSSLVCDSVVVSEAIDTAYYNVTRIFNDSLRFGVEFIFYDSAYLDTGRSEYFTAWFHLKPEAVWETRSKLLFDTISLGNRGDFTFDSKLKGAPPLNKAAPEIAALLSADNVYRPLVIMGQVRALIPVATDDNDNPIPGEYSLAQNYPNPFNASTAIRFSLPRREKVRIDIYNILGQLVAELAGAEYEAGDHIVVWDRRDLSGHPAASGIYLYRIVTEGFSRTKKMILVK